MRGADECICIGSPPQAASRSFINASNRAMDDIGTPPSGFEDGFTWPLEKKRSRIVSCRPGPVPSASAGRYSLIGVTKSMTAELFRDNECRDPKSGRIDSLVAVGGRRSSIVQGDPIVSDAELNILDLSSESMLERLLVFERMDGLNSAVLGSPLVRNNDDGDSVGVSYSFSWSPSRNAPSTVLARTGGDPGTNRDCISRAHLSRQYGSSVPGRNNIVVPDPSFRVGSFSGTSWLLRRKARDEGKWFCGCSALQRLTTRVGMISDFLFFAATSPI